jgi:hypothetical protein
MWPFSEKEEVKQETMLRYIKPSREDMEKVVDGNFTGYLVYQWCNWASRYLGKKERFELGGPMQIKTVAYLYLACEKYLLENPVVAPKSATQKINNLLLRLGSDHRVLCAEEEPVVALNDFLEAMLEAIVSKIESLEGKTKEKFEPDPSDC